MDGKNELEDKNIYRLIAECEEDIEGWKRERRNHLNNHSYVIWCDKKIQFLEDELNRLKRRKEDLKN